MRCGAEILLLPIIEAGLRGLLAGLGGAVPESRHPRTQRQSTGSLIPSCRLRSDKEDYMGSELGNPFPPRENSARFR